MNYLETLKDISKKKKNFMVCTLVDVRGSAPQDVGAKVFVGPEGLLAGTIGGGKIENHTIEVAKELLHTREGSCLKRWNLQRDIGMSCGGEVSIFFEEMKLDHQFKVNIFGAGHVAQELVKLLSAFDCSINIYDTRPEWIDKISEYHNVTKIVSTSLKDEVVNLADGSFVVLMTMGHATDLPILNEALKVREKFSYLGVIGSVAKRKALERELKELNQLNNDFTCPIGEPIGSNAPIEIALSITAQLIKIRDVIFKTTKRTI